MIGANQAALGIFAAAMGLGINLAWRVSRGRSAALIHGLGHAAVAATGVLTLSVGVFGGASNKLVNSALFFFVLALIGGLFILIFRVQREPAPLAVIYLHASSALLAWGLLLAGLIR